MQLKKIKGLLCACLLLPLLEPIHVLATAPGESFTVSVSCGNMEGSVTAQASNATITDAANWCERGRTVSATATAGGAGTASITFVAVDLIDTSTMTQVANGTSIGGDSVNVVAPTPSGGSGGGSSGGGSSGGGSSSGGSGSGGGETQTPTTPQTPAEKKSSDANLSALNVSTGTLAPEFSADITDYKVTLPKDATSIRVDASASDSKASVSGTGEHTLEPGDNEIKVSVSAEDGTVKNYIIVVSVDETPDVFVTYNEKKLGIVKNLSDVTPPDTFEETTVTFEGKEVHAWKSNLRNLTLLYMIDEANEKNFYIYDTEKGVITSIYKPMALLGRNIAIIDIPIELQKRTGMVFGEVEVDTQKLQGWTFEDESFANYILLYVMDEQGKTQYYLYEKSENTLQLYSGQAALTQISYEQMLQDHEDALMQRMYMIIALLITNVVTILLLLISILKKKKKKGRTYNNTKQLKEPYMQEKETDFADVSVTIHEEANSTSAPQEDTTLHLEPFHDGLDEEI